jgi:hypothetical protein
MSLPESWLRLLKLDVFPRIGPVGASIFRSRYANNYVLTMMAVPSFGSSLAYSVSFHSAHVKCTTWQLSEIEAFKLSPLDGVRGNFAKRCDTFSLNFESVRLDRITWSVECNLDEWQRFMNFHRISDASRPRCPGHSGRGPFRTGTVRTWKRQVQSADERTLKGHADPGPTTKLSLN